MPSTQTVTTYHSFIAGTRAKAGEVENNFSQHRGHSLPINTDTQTASDNTHYLGATDHRWKGAYLGEPPYVNGTRMNRMEIQLLFDGSVPTDVVDPIGGMDLVAYRSDTPTDVMFQFQIPPSYVPTDRIGLTLKGFSDTNASFAMRVTTSLLKASITSATNTAANAYTSTATITPHTAPAMIFEDTQLFLCSTGGLINSLTLAVGDVLQVQVMRDTSATADTSSGYAYFTNFIVDMDG